jgi:hypothetical protein
VPKPPNENVGDGESLLPMAVAGHATARTLQAMILSNMICVWMRSFLPKQAVALCSEPSALD